MSKELTSTEKYYRTALVNQRKVKVWAREHYRTTNMEILGPVWAVMKLTRQFLNYRAGANGYPTVLYGKTLALAR
jgi:hypothetical protein